MRPAQHYFTECVGEWSGPLDLEVYDRPALRRSMGLLDSASLRMLAAWPRAFGEMRIRTSVRELSEDEFEHTTRFVLGDLELLSTTETIKIRDDDRSFVLVGVGRTLTNRTGLPISGTGSVDEDSCGARYEIDWMGSSLEQVTTRASDLVTLTWNGPGYRGEQRLVRQK